MSHSASAAQSRHSSTALAGVVAAVALLAGCGTAVSGSTAAQSTTSTTPVASTSPASTPRRSPTAGPTTGAARVLVPLVLPAGTHHVSGQVTGVVTLGVNRCLFLRTDAGQQFGLTGVLADHLRTLLIGRMVPLEVKPAESPKATLSARVGVRIDASGSVSTGASVCSIGYSFAASQGTVDGSVLALR